MIDEELKNKATEWIRSQGWSEENLPNDEYIQMCDAYIAGAKENQLSVEEMLKRLIKGGYVKSGIYEKKEHAQQWHIVVDGDLPKEKKEYLNLNRKMSNLKHRMKK